MLSFEFLSKRGLLPGFIFISFFIIFQSGAGGFAFAGDAQNADGNGQALIMLKSEDVGEMQATIAELERKGVKVQHVIAPRALIARLSTETEQAVMAISNVASVHRAKVAPFAVAEGKDTAMGVSLWNHLENAKKSQGSRKIPPEARPLAGDAFEPTLTQEPIAPMGASAMAASAVPGYNNTSEFMVGKVAVGLILPESDGGTENWDGARQTVVLNKIVEGLDWWVTKGGSSANLTFYYDVKFSVPTQYEPITMDGTGDEWVWVGDIFANMGYTNGNGQIARARDYINDIRSQFQTDWCFAVIVVDSLNDADGIFGNGMYFAWANLGGPYFIMTYDNDGYGIDNMDIVARHETGHIFLAGDEYCQPGYSCCGFGYYGYLSIYNGNCESNNPNSVDCVMKNNADAICQYTNGQVGWRDTDGDGMPDTIDNRVGNTLNFCQTPTTQTILTFTGSAADIACIAPVRTDITINRISSVKYRIDGGPWADADAADGEFDEDAEEYTFTTPSIGAGIHRISTRAWSTTGNGSMLVYQDVEVQTPSSGQAGWPVPSEYARHISLNPTLDWRAGNWTQAIQGHAVYFGMDYNDVNDAQPGNPLGVYMGTQDSNSYATGPLCPGATCYWRIDEYNDANGDSPWKGRVWQFTTTGGEANEPGPATGAVALGVPPELSWKAGAWATQHDIYFGASQADVLDATTASTQGVYKGRQASSTYALGNLDYNLAADATYYWRVDEINESNATGLWAGDVWEFKNVEYFIVDDFDHYADTNAMLQKWQTGYESCFETIGNGQIEWHDGALRYNYHNNGSTGTDYFSEARLVYQQGVDWTGGGVLPDNDRIRSIAISYLGAADNDADPNYDRMYAAVEDTDGNFSVVYSADPNANKAVTWQKLNIDLNDFNGSGVNLTSVKFLYLGFGIRCNEDFPGGTGIVMFDDIRLYQRRCVPEYGPIGDITDDCKVNLNDVKFMGQEWLTDDPTADISPPANPDGIVNFSDFVVMAGNWLNEQFWP